MKVILQKDVARIGKKLDVVEVPDGHARNYLIPRQLAKPATPQNLKHVEKQRQKHVAEQAAAEEAFQDMLTKLTDMNVTHSAEANEKGHLFKAVNAADIAACVRDAVGTEVSPQHVVLDKAIKEVGEHTVGLQMGEHKGSFTLSVKPK